MSWYDEISKLIGQSLDSETKAKAKGKRDAASMGLMIPKGELALPKGELALPKGELALPKGELALPKGELANVKGELTNPKGQLVEFEPRSMRYATPSKGAGIGSVTSGATVLNPVAATVAALLASTETMGDATLPESRIQAKLEQLRDEVMAEKKFNKDFRDTANSPAPPISAPEITDRKASSPLLDAYNSPTKPISAPEITDRKAMAEPAKYFEDIPKAIPVTEDAESKMQMLFTRAHGSDFDPKSSMDKKKMEAIRQLYAKEGSDQLTPNQFALKLYGRR